MIEVQRREGVNIGYDSTIESFQRIPKKLAALILLKAMRNL